MQKKYTKPLLFIYHIKLNKHKFYVCLIPIQVVENTEVCPFRVSNACAWQTPGEKIQ